MTPNSTQIFYELNANNYFLSTHAVDLERLWQKMNAVLQPRAYILDLGCGSGRDLRYFGGQGYRAVGLDHCHNLLKLAQNFSRRPLISADFRSLPFRQGVFDAVWAVGSLLHLAPQAIAPALLEIRRVLKPEAFLFASIKKGCGETIDAKGRYFKFYQRAEWQDLLTRNGYAIVEIEESIELRQTGEITWLECLTKAI